MAILFINDEYAYQKWLVENPSGFVVNLKIRPSATYAVLHRSSCRMIRDQGAAYTGPNYIKLCASSVEEAAAALHSTLCEDFSGYSTVCRICTP